MIAQTDSIVGNDTVQSSLPSGGEGSGLPLTPAMVLKWLPRDATPAQQDSAIQSRFKPAPIRWSNRPDTLHLPGHDRGHNLLDVNIPQYYREGFFSADTLFHPELTGGRYGTAGDPVPYSVSADDVITSLLLFVFLTTIVALTNVRGFISRQAKSFFYTSHGGTTEITETAGELRFQAFLVLTASLLLALLYYSYTLLYVGDTFTLQSRYQLIAIYFAIVVGYYLLRALLYSIVNTIFFDSKKNSRWVKALLFITAVEGMLLFPAVVLQSSFALSPRNVETYFIIVLVLVKILTIYKCYAIFFRRNVVGLQIILYFCALELIPMLALWGVLDITANSLKINF